MCEFVSWKQMPNGEIRFLTADMIYRTRRGKELQKHTVGSDFIGHGAIDFYFGGDTQKKGISHECTDFSSPDNFPKEIVTAIKAGKFRGLGTPEGLLNKKAWAEYEKIRQQARAEYEKIRQQARAEYEKIRQPAWAEYEKIRQQARAEYEKIRQQAFWDLFALPENRTKAWR